MAWMINYITSFIWVFTLIHALIPVLNDVTSAMAGMINRLGLLILVRQSNPPGSQYRCFVDWLGAWFINYDKLLAQALWTYWWDSTTNTSGNIGLIKWCFANKCVLLRGHFNNVIWKCVRSQQPPEPFRCWNANISWALQCYVFWGPGWLRHQISCYYIDYA